jgi:hypothetical protein
MKKLLLLISLSVLLFASKNNIKPVDNVLYQKECGSCHFAYQPELLPKRSWEKTMSTLQEHFKTDASLDETDTQTLLEYLTKNAPTNIRSLSASQTPLRISDTPHFKKEHRKIPVKLISQKEVGSISNCIACHRTADRGIYSERAINIPNYGGWDD